METLLLKEILETADAADCESANHDIFADGYLLQNNEIYRNVREHSLQIGCTYSEAQADYLVYPFFQLHKIVATKNIPYVPGAKLLKMIESQRPETFTTDDAQLPESHHLHEACARLSTHCLRCEQLGNEVCLYPVIALKA